MINVPSGKIPNHDFVSNDKPHDGLRIGFITRVDEFNLKADVRVITGSDQCFEIDLIQGMAGPRSFLGGIPEVGSMVVIGYRRRSKQIYDAMILGYIPTGGALGRKFDPFAAVDPSEVTPEDLFEAEKLLGPTIRYKNIRGKPGDILGMSSSGSEMYLTKDVRFTNRAGDLFELRDVDRTLVQQSIHRVSSDGASYQFSGPVRRGGMNLPLEIFEKDSKGNLTNKVRNQTSRYYGQDDLAAAGISPNTFLNTTTSTVLDRINNSTEFPPVTYSNGRQVFYASSNPATNFEDGLNGGSIRAFTEHRLEVYHESDLEPDVLEEIDGFSVDRRRPYIECILGTVVGNDPYSTMGQRQYGKVLKPKLFDTFEQTSKPDGLRLEECLRPPSTPVDEALNMAAAYLFRISSPRAESKGTFGVSVSKQGKLFANIPGSTSENNAEKNISAEISMEGALKMFLGAMAPDLYSLHLTCEGGVYLDIGSNSRGECITTNFRGAIKQIFNGNGNSVDDVAHSVDIQGNAESHVSGSDTQVVKGSYQKTVDGGYTVNAGTVNLKGNNGFNGTFGGWSTTISGKTQNNYADAYKETLSSGGKLCTILAGGHTENILSGAKTTNVAAGSVTVNSTAGSYTVSVGTGSISLTTGSGSVAMSTAAGGLSIAAGGGAISITAGLSMTLTATTLVSVISPQILLGGPPAVLGVARGTPMQPPGSPSLDWVTGLPLQGSTVIRSI